MGSNPKGVNIQKAKKQRYKMNKGLRIKENMEMSDRTMGAFVDKVWEQLPLLKSNYQMLYVAVEKVMKENNLMITSRPIPAASILRSKDPVNNPPPTNMPPETREVGYYVSYMSLEFPDTLQVVYFREDYWMTAFLTGLGANKKIYDLKIEVVSK